MVYDMGLKYYNLVHPNHVGSFIFFSLVLSLQDCFVVVEVLNYIIGRIYVHQIHDLYFIFSALIFFLVVIGQLINDV